MRGDLRAWTGQVDRRQSRRLRNAGVSNFIRPNGDAADCEVVDIWLKGASLQTNCRPLVGEVVQIGRIAARVTYHYERGIGVEFHQPSSRQLSREEKSAIRNFIEQLRPHW